MSAAYDQSILGTANNSITFNNYSASPLYRLRDFIPQKRDIREQDVDIPEAMGVSDYGDFEGKSYFVIDGTMYPRSEQEYYQGRRALRKLASLDISQADPLSDTGYVPYQWQEAGQWKQIFVKVMYVDGLGESPRNGFKLNFRFFCEIKYPVIFDVTPITATLGNSTATTSGSSGYPFLYPVLYGLTSYSSNGAITNPGDMATYPSFVINGPINRPKIQNTTTGEFIELSTNLLTTGDTIIISYDQDTPPSITQAGNSVYSNLTTGSTFFKLKPGINNLTLTGSTVGSGVFATVSALPAYPMS